MRLIASVTWVGLVLVACSHPADTKAGRPHFARTVQAASFLRGNLHAHSLASDGDAPSSSVLSWYQAHGYAFAALTDHNVLALPSRFRSLESRSFTVLPGEEISMWVSGKQVHVNALCTDERIDGGEFESAAAALASAVTDVRSHGGIAIINHPNFDWALAPSDVVAVAGRAQLLEIASGHPYVHSLGDATHPSHEALWDDALTAGRDVMAVAVDDVHHVRASGDPPAYPGVGWVEVFAASRSAEDLCAALGRGDLYASTGPELRRILVSEDAYAIEPGAGVDALVFIGAGGRVLERVEHPRGTVTYRLRGDEGYVRARVDREDEHAWSPAVRVDVN